MDNTEILKCLDSLSEDKMIERVILPLYKKKFKKFYEVEFTGKDKNEDQGIDITYYEVSPDTKAKEYTGIQVKQGNINTSKGANGIASIGIQAQQAFEKKIANTNEKNNYYIKTYIILTTGDITGTARAQIVDQFNSKNIRFIDGKILSNWISADFWDEFIEMFPQESEDDTDTNVSPIDMIIQYLEIKCKKEIKDIKLSFNVVDSFKRKIIGMLMVGSPLKAFDIARGLGKSISFIEDDLQGLQNEDIINVDEDGYWLNYGKIGNWNSVKEQAEIRIGQLNYEDEVDISDIIDELFI